MNIEIKNASLITVRFAGDSGDGMQLMGEQFTRSATFAGNDVQTFPDFPAEIRAPMGTLAGVSGFQLSFSDKNIHTPGDRLDVLVAMNPAALKTNLRDVKLGGVILINSDNFTDKDYEKALYQSNPLEDGTLSGFEVISVPMTKLTIHATQDSGVSHAQAKKCKNMFALGVMMYLYDRDLDHTREWLEKKFSRDEFLMAANIDALIAGYSYADTAELFSARYRVNKARLAQGLYRQMNGNEGFALAMATVAKRLNKKVLLAGYPITPASTILHSAAKLSAFGVQILQAEDEIAAVCAAIGASFGGNIGVTSTSGPGLDLKSEALGLAVMTELPLILIDVQRAGPSTGMPTKVEQSDLLAACFNRHGDTPVVVIAPQSPSDCFSTFIEAVHIATAYMTPVIILSDAFLANASLPWRVVEPENCVNFEIQQGNAEDAAFPYRRNTLGSRPWIIPGTPNAEHCIGGIEKNEAGAVCYDEKNHETMTKLRAQKVANVAHAYPPLVIDGSLDADATLIISWGSTYGSVLDACVALRETGVKLAHIHLRHMNPFPKELGKTVMFYQKVIVCELNNGQLNLLLQQQFCRRVNSITKVMGKPFLVAELIERISHCINEKEEIV